MNIFEEFPESQSFQINLDSIASLWLAIVQKANVTNDADVISHFAFKAFTRNQSEQCFFVTKKVKSQFDSILSEYSSFDEQAALNFIFCAMLPGYYETHWRDELIESLDDFIFKLKLHLFTGLENYDLKGSAKIRFQTSGDQSAHLFYDNEVLKIASLAGQSISYEEKQKTISLIKFVTIMAKGRGSYLNELDTIEKIISVFDHLRKNLPRKEWFRKCTVLMISEILVSNNIVGSNEIGKKSPAISLIADAFQAADYLREDSYQEKRKKINKAFYTDLDFAFMTRAFDLLE
jgi:hypothetical protein